MLIYDLVDPQELVGFVRAVPTPAFTLSRHLPNEEIQDIEYRFTRGDFAEQDAAVFRAFDAESPIGTRPGASRVSGELPPISKKMLLGEEARLRLQRLLGAGNAQSRLVEQVFNDAARLVRSVAARVELARGDAIFNGKVTINENGVVATADYGYVAANLVGPPATLWSNTAATIIDDLTTWSSAYRDRTGGQLPQVILTSRAVRANMLKNAEIARLAATQAGAPQRVTAATLNAVLGDYELPPVEVYDVSVKVGGVTTNVIPQNKLALLPAPNGAGELGRTFYGVTADALELAEARQIGADQTPGLVAVVEKQFDPVALWTKVSGIALPAIANPALVTIATVQ